MFTPKSISSAHLSWVDNLACTNSGSQLCLTSCMFANGRIKRIRIRIWKPSGFQLRLCNWNHQWDRIISGAGGGWWNVILQGYSPRISFKNWVFSAPFWMLPTVPKTDCPSLTSALPFLSFLQKQEWDSQDSLGDSAQKSFTNVPLDVTILQCMACGVVIPKSVMPWAKYVHRNKLYSKCFCLLYVVVVNCVYNDCSLCVLALSSCMRTGQ